MTLDASIKNAVQACVAVFLAIAVGHFFHFERSYWAVLTTIFLVAQTFGESIKRALERVIMTILGCVAGTFLFTYLHPMPGIIIGLMLISTFFITYFFAISYALATFFLTIMVVFLFGTLTTWNTSLLEARIIETIIGAVIAVATTAIIFPLSAKHKLQDALPNFIEQCEKTTDDIFHLILHDNHPVQQPKIIFAYNAMQNEARMIRYESLFSIYSKQSLDQILFELRIFTHHIGMAYDIAKDLHDSLNLVEIQEEIKAIRLILSHNMNLLHTRLKHQKSDEHFQTLAEIRAKIRESIYKSLKKHMTQTDQWFKFYSMLYSIRKANESIDTLLTLLDD